MRDGRPHNYLVDEWKAVNGGDLCLHVELKPFLNAQFENIKLAVDKEKTAAIKLLVGSGSFATTHLAVGMVLTFFDALTAEDANILIEAGIDNQQIRWIADDADVCYFYRKLLKAFEGQFADNLQKKGEDTFGTSD